MALGFQSGAFQYGAFQQAAVTPSSVYTFAGNRRKPYIYKGQKYWLTDDELRRLIAQDLATRKEVKTFKRGKQKTIPEPVWNAIMAGLSKLDEKPSIVVIEPYDDSDDEEAIAMLLMH
jgi:hypothetical protein